MNALPPQAAYAAQRAKRRGVRVRPTDIVWAICLGLCAAILLLYGWHLRSREAQLDAASSGKGPPADADVDKASHGWTPPSYASAPMLVSYAFYEKDPTQRGNLEFFLQQGWLAPPGPSGRDTISWVFTVAGDLCSPCAAAFPITSELPADPSIGVQRAVRVDRSVDDPDDPEEYLPDAYPEPDPDTANAGGTTPPPGSAVGARHNRGGEGKGGRARGHDRDRRGGGGGGGVDSGSGSGALGGRGPAAGLTLVLRRSENVGMDIASHNVSLEYVRRHVAGGLRRFRYFFLLNSSVRGPLYPAYLPPVWHWTHAFLERFIPAPRDDPRWRRPPVIRVLPAGTAYGKGAPPPGRPVVRAVGSSLVCLPEADAGGPGPRLESWALMLDDVALRLLMEKGVLKVRTCKTCADGQDGIVVGGEYGITSVLLEAGHNVATLMSKYARDVDWRDRRHWGCNDMVHPSRHGTYDGIGFHPYETIFVKSSWHVADPYTRRYSTWVTQHKEGDAGTDGEWNEHMYRYAISPEAQQPNLLEAAYNVDRVRQLLAQHREAEAEEARRAEEQRQAGERAMEHSV